MALPNDEITTGFLAELESFEALVRGLDDRQWATPTRCEGWTVADVSAHFIGSIADVAAGRLDGLGTPEVTLREVEERKGRTPAELADELAGATKVGRDLLAAFDDNAWSAPSPGGYDGTLADGVEALWFDGVAHADDIRTALGQPRTPERIDIDASLSHIADILTKQGWGPATLALDGQREFAVGDGSGRRITGDAWQFVLAATGRGDPAVFGLDESVNIYR